MKHCIAFEIEIKMLAIMGTMKNALQTRPTPILGKYQKVTKTVRLRHHR